jgi:hypothetical protein
MTITRHCHEELSSETQRGSLSVPINRFLYKDEPYGDFYLKSVCGAKKGFSTSKFQWYTEKKYECLLHRLPVKKNASSGVAVIK